jgi:hypothetical protein
VVIWYIFPRFGILEQEKSGKPASLWSCFAFWQGDQMSLWKNCPKCRTTHVLLKWIHSFTLDISSQKCRLLLYFSLKNYPK